MPRIKASPKKCIKSNIQHPTNSWVFLIKGEALELSDQYTGSGTPDIVNLRHPKTNESAIFLFSSVNNSVQEILTYNDKKRSWFIDNKTKSDGKMLLSTPIDPLFLILPYLKNSCVNQAMPIEQLLKDDEYAETERLLKTVDLIKYLNVIADRKGDEELNAFKYNEEKTLSWLKKKTERVAEILKQKNIHVGSGAVSATLKTNSTATESDYLRYAHGIVSEYLMDDLCQKLLKYLNLPEDNTTITTQNKRKSSTSNLSQETKRVKIDDNNDDENCTSTEKNSALDLSKPEQKTSKTQSTKDKARAKAATGSKSISSFFKKT